MLQIVFILLILLSVNLVIIENFETFKIHKKTIPATKRSLYGHIDQSDLFGNTTTLNYYYVNIFIGTPGIKQSLIVDTGSGNTGVPCKSLCENCGYHLNSYYDPTST